MKIETITKVARLYYEFFRDEGDVPWARLKATTKERFEQQVFSVILRKPLTGLTPQHIKLIKAAWEVFS